MKNFIQNVLLLCVLLIFGYCINDPQYKLANDVMGIGNPILDQGLLDTLNQGRSVEGMTQWESQIVHKVDTMTFKIVDNFFIAQDKKSYKETVVRAANGVWEAFWNNKIREHILFDNEVVYKSTQEGSLSILTKYKRLFNEEGQEILKKGYTKLYVLDPSVHYIWRSRKTKGLGEWVEFSNEGFDPIYYIVRESNEEFKRIVVVPKEENGIIIPDDFVSYGGIDKAKILTYKKRTKR